MERLITKVDNEYRFNDVSVESLKKVANKLGELEDKIENGTLIELPCNVGDTIYCIDYVYCSNGQGIYDIIETKIRNLEFQEEGIIVHFDNMVFGELLDYYNKTWFTDKTKAEERLKELNNE